VGVLPTAEDRLVENPAARDIARKSMAGSIATTIRTKSGIFRWTDQRRDQAHHDLVRQVQRSALLL
jgi:hypothetical protein